MTVEPEMKLIQRPLYMDRLAAHAWNGFAKVLVGIRRCGKSSALKLYASGLKDCNVIYINTELAENYDLRDWKKFLGEVNSRIDGKGRNVLIVDEIQNIEGWDLALRDLIARGACDIYVTGSNSSLLSSDYSTHMGGRFNSMRMYPLSFRECLDFRREFGGTGDVLERFMRVGGMPSLWRMPEGIDESMGIIRDIVSTSIANDIEERYSLRGRSALTEVLRFVLSTIGSYVSANNIYKSMKSAGSSVSVSTVYAYLEYLENANILIRASVYDLRGHRIIGSKYKYYATDIGIKHALIGYRVNDTPGHMENIIFTDLLSRGFDVYVGDPGGKEIDFVAVKDDRRIYIQVCQTIQSEETMALEFSSLDSVDDSFPKYLVLLEPGPYSGFTDKGVRCCGLEEFLSKDDLFVQ